MSKDYKKLYEEALERAKYLKENTDSVGAKDISYNFEYIFPELHESEDDRIRKAIIDSVTFKRKLTDAEQKDCLSWLEKQGEQNPTHKFKIGDTIHKIGENTVFPMTIEKIEDGYYACNNSRTFVNIEFQDDYELVEQKPAWSEEDEEMFCSLKKLLNESSCHSCTEGSDKILNWLKSIKPNHWKPSKEQMNDLYYASKQLSVLRPSLKTLYEQLKKL